LGDGQMHGFNHARRADDGLAKCHPQFEAPAGP
jgi:hypothetical protein